MRAIGSLDKCGLYNRQQDEIQQEEGCGHPEDRMDLLGLLFADFGDAVEDKPGGDAVGNAVADRHEYAGKKGGHRFVEIVPLDLLEGGHHHNADHDQGRRRRGIGDRADKGCKERADCKAEGDDHAGQPCAAARADACGAFHKGGGVGGAEDGADRGGRGVGKERLVHFGFEAGRGFHRLLVLVAEDAGAASRADKGADGVKGVREAEGEDGDQHQRKLGNVGEEGGQARRGEDRAESRGKLLAGFGEADSILRGGYAHRNTDQGCHHNADEDRALDLQNQQDDGQRQPDQEKPERGLVQCRQSGDAGIKGDDLDVQQADIGDKNADAAADRGLQAAGNGLDNMLAELSDCDDNVDDAADKHHGQRLLPGEFQRKADRINEESVEAHARRLRVGDVGDQAHDQGADDGGDDGCQENGAPFHTRLAENAGVYRDDVRHRKECGEAGDNLPSRCGAVLLELE